MLSVWVSFVFWCFVDWHKMKAFLVSRKSEFRKEKKVFKIYRRPRLVIIIPRMSNLHFLIVRWLLQGPYQWDYLSLFKFYFYMNYTTCNFFIEIKYFFFNFFIWFVFLLCEFFKIFLTLDIWIVKQYFFVQVLLYSKFNWFINKFVNEIINTTVK